MTLIESAKLTIKLLREQQRRLAEKPSEADTVDFVDPPPPPFPSVEACRVLKDLLDATNDLYQGNCVL
jgi:hypothetical protein